MGLFEFLAAKICAWFNISKFSQSAISMHMHDGFLVLHGLLFYAW